MHRALRHHARRPGRQTTGAKDTEAQNNLSHGHCDVAFYNEVRPHSAIGNKVPAALHRATGNPGQPAAR